MLLKFVLAGIEHTIPYLNTTRVISNQFRVLKLIGIILDIYKDDPKNVE